MAQSIEESLLKAIQKDDKKAFNALNGSYRCGSCRLGRFPVLSLMYLYKARRLISAYESEFIKITSWEKLPEPVEISKTFSLAAGKCLRLYLSEVCSPIEMLLILNKTRRLKRVYPAVKASSAVKERLKSVYAIRYSLNIKFEGDEIIIDRRPLSYREKKRIATIGLCSLLAVSVAVAAPLTTVALIPKRAEGDVLKLEHIDFNSKSVYTLKRDIEVPEDFSVKRVNCTIDGNGKKITLGSGASLGSLSGKISNATIETYGNAVFTAIASGGTLENLTVNITADLTENKNTAFVAETNSGTIDGLTVNVGGKIHASADGGTGELKMGGIVMNNSASSDTVYGTVKNCTVNYSGFSLAGEVSANAVFGGVAGVNYGDISDCTVTGEIVSDTVDLAGLCTDNYGLISGCVNSASLSQTTASSEWSPMMGGVTLKNAATITECVNSGAISAVGGATVNCGGISARSYGLTADCLSKGEIRASASAAYVGGITGISEITRINIWTFGFGAAVRCISENTLDITVTGEEPSCVGGITGLVQQASYGEEYFGGTVTDCFFTGENCFAGNYSGSIVGVTGANIYEANSYTNGGTEYHNFENNYFLTGSAFGAVVDADGENFSAAADKGAQAATREEIENTDVYREIMKKLADKIPFSS